MGAFALGGGGKVESNARDVVEKTRMAMSFKCQVSLFAQEPGELDMACLRNQDCCTSKVRSSRVGALPHARNSANLRLT